MNHSYPTRVLMSACFLALTSTASAQEQTNPLISGGKGTAIIQYNIPLTLGSYDERLTAADANGLADVYDIAMTSECAFFKTPCPSSVFLSVMPPEYFACGSVDLIAACTLPDANDPNIGHIDFNANYLATTPAYDVVAHETMHLLQGSPDPTECDFWKEGEAELARYYWGGEENHAASGFSLHEAAQMTDMITDPDAAGGFLLWFHQTWGDNALVAFHAVLYAHQCPDDAFWKAQTGFETFDALWNGYAGQGQPTTAPNQPNAPEDPNQPSAPVDSP